MSALSIQVPFPVFNDRDGQPLDNGYVWIGVPNLPPQTNPVNVYFDEALTIIAPQPLRTINGYISRFGSPAQVYVDGVNFSILVQDSKGTMVYNFPDGTGISPNASGVAFTGFKGQVGFVSDLADDDGSDWIGFEQAGTGAVARSAQDKMRDVVSVKDFGAVGDGVTDDTAAVTNVFAHAAATGQAVYIPAGTYKITSDLEWPERVLVFGDGEQKSILLFDGCQLVLEDGQFWQGRDFGVKRIGSAGYAMRLEGVSEGARRIYFSNVGILGSTGGGAVLKGGWLMTWVNPYIMACAGIGLLTETGAFVTGWNSLNLIGGEIQGNNIGIVLDRVKQFSLQGTAVEGNTTAGIGIGQSVEAVSILGYFEGNGTGHIVGYDHSGGTVGQAISVTVQAGTYFLRGTGGTDSAISIPAVRQFIVEDGVAVRGYSAATSPVISVADVGDSVRGFGHIGQIRTDAPAAQTLSNSCWYFGRKRFLTYSLNTSLPGASDVTVNFPVNPQGLNLNSSQRAQTTITVNLTGAAGDGVFLVRGRNAAGTIVSAQVASTVALSSGINSFTITSGVDWSDSVSYIDFARVGTSVSDTAGDATLVGVQITTYVNEVVNV